MSLNNMINEFIAILKGRYEHHSNANMKKKRYKYLNNSKASPLLVYASAKVYHQCSAEEKKDLISKHVRQFNKLPNLQLFLLAESKKFNDFITKQENPTTTPYYEQFEQIVQAFVLKSEASKEQLEALNECGHLFLKIINLEIEEKSRQQILEQLQNVSTINHHDHPVLKEHLETLSLSLPQKLDLNGRLTNTLMQTQFDRWREWLDHKGKKTIHPTLFFAIQFMDGEKESFNQTIDALNQHYEHLLPTVRFTLPEECIVPAAFRKYQILVKETLKIININKPFSDQKTVSPGKTTELQVDWTEDQISEVKKIINSLNDIAQKVSESLEPRPTLSLISWFFEPDPKIKIHEAIDTHCQSLSALINRLGKDSKAFNDTLASMYSQPESLITCRCY